MTIGILTNVMALAGNICLGVKLLKNKIMYLE